MNCPDCKKSISSFKVKPNFHCPHCGISLVITNHTKALILSLGTWALISILVWTSFLFHENTAFTFFLDLIIGPVVCLFLYMRITKVKTKGK